MVGGERRAGGERAQPGGVAHALVEARRSATTMPPTVPWRPASGAANAASWPRHTRSRSGEAQPARAADECIEALGVALNRPGLRERAQTGPVEDAPSPAVADQRGLAAVDALDHGAHLGVERRLPREPQLGVEHRSTRAGQATCGNGVQADPALDPDRRPVVASEALGHDERGLLAHAAAGLVAAGDEPAGSGGDRGLGLHFVDDLDEDERRMPARGRRSRGRWRRDRRPRSRSNPARPAASTRGTVRRGRRSGRRTDPGRPCASSASTARRRASSPPRVRSTRPTPPARDAAIATPGSSRPAGARAASSNGPGLMRPARWEGMPPLSRPACGGIGRRRRG